MILYSLQLFLSFTIILFQTPSIGAILRYTLNIYRLHDSGRIALNRLLSFLNLARFSNFRLLHSTGTVRSI